MTATATLTVEAPEAGARPTALLPFAQLVRISLYWLGLTAIDAAVSQYISFRLAYTDIRGDIPLGTATTLLTIGGALLAIIIQPTVGSISDYAVTKWGRRKPFIVFGSLLDVVFLIGIANSNTLLALGAFVMLLTFSTNIARGPFQGYVPDLVAEPQVGIGERHGRDDADPRQRHRPRPREPRGDLGQPAARAVRGRDRGAGDDAQRRPQGRQGHAAQVPRGALVAGDRGRDVGDGHPPGAVVPVAGRIAPVLPHRGRDPVRLRDGVPEVRASR